MIQAQGPPHHHYQETHPNTIRIITQQLLLLTPGSNFPPLSPTSILCIN